MSYQLLLGDCLDVMRTLPSSSVQCCVTSPPYFGLRAYLDNGDANKPLEIGTEQTPEEYVARLVEVFREVRRLLRDDGVCWLNLGDSYGRGTRPNNPNDGSRGKTGNTGQVSAVAAGAYGSGAILQDKQLLGIPWRVAFALQADNWILRSEIIWHKKAPMPESVRDRPTKAHEQIFLLSKSPTYFYDADAIAEPAIGNDPGNLTHKHQNGTGIVLGRKTEPNSGLLTVGAAATRNKRSVWSLGPESYNEAHFATMPSKLIEPCILAGTSAYGCCAVCGAPWTRVTEKQNPPHDGKTESAYANGTTANRLAMLRQAARARGEEYSNRTTTTGWQPTCTCNQEGIDYAADDLELIATPTGERMADDPTLLTGRAGMNRPRGDNEGSRPITRYEQRQYAMQLRNSARREQMEHEAGSAFAHYIRTDSSGARPVPPDLLERWIGHAWLERVSVPTFTPFDPVPCTVLDPFAGSGTTLAVALKHGRNAIGIELNPDYHALAHTRIERTQPMLLEVTL